MQKIVFACGLAVLAFAGPAAAQRSQPSMEQRQACEQDYFRLCQHVGTEENAARQCLIKNMRRLSPTCRSAFQSGKRRN
jgi:hypothetical protein